MFFDQMNARFEDVPTDGGIATEPFLDACAALVPIFDALGSTAFAPIKSDINGNIKKLRGWHEKDPAGTATLEGMVTKEIDAKTTTASGSATDALLWLKRALSFISVFLRELVAGAEPATAATTAYGETLRKYHNFLVRGIFSVAMRACPTRKKLMDTLAGDSGADDAGVVERIRQFQTSFDPQLAQIDAFYQKNALDN
ncbi:uncharacterized protein MONBRDRAFT_30960 [Monosiga brevicollis MX1]|uniref:Glycolipid transfer protein domain-containing protein n=1 Tax=Monosiga brevicollis TaxID=81824 RepID=A9UQE5_MONBE|nr:uncharacterized protein MONBRDRAFT_30960 [Monosiga brevicollis MX1]EDQ93031.1 predicted protein [Monosiga brevicollis MX1]|eukprot:XP_001742793.1 hypothetical protein [Monosiga brevicollis MX1]